MGIYFKRIPIGSIRLPETLGSFIIAKLDSIIIKLTRFKQIPNQSLAKK